MAINPIIDIIKASNQFTGFFVIVVAIIAIWMQRKTAKEKNALEFLQELTNSETLQKGSKTLKKYHFDKNKSVELIATSDDKEIKKDAKEVRDLLNYFETLAIGVRMGIYDKRTVLLSRKQQIIHTFKYSQSYIKSIREKLENKCLYENLEWFVKCIESSWYQQFFCKIKRLFKCKAK
jgi:hypothetical protein